MNMKTVVFAGLILSLSSLLGTYFGYRLKSIPDVLHDVLTSFASGAMLATAVFGLIEEAIELSNVYLTLAGIALGVITVVLIDLHHPKGIENFDRASARTYLFVLAVAIHHFPEGLATGIAFTTENTFNSWALTSGIALHNFPESMIIMIMLLQTGMPAGRCALISTLIVGLQFVATVLGFSLVSLASILVPIGLAYASGTIIYTIVDDMIPETHGKEENQLSSLAFIVGFCLIMVIERFG
jgi:ZIP family zinc transporter